MDPYGRLVESIRIAVTQRCNLNCFYCHLEGEVSNNKKEMTSEEIQKIIALAASFEIKKVKLTGGEPLLRNDILNIIQMIKDTAGIKEVSLTTNGFFLARYAKNLLKSGLARVNISLDTLNHQKFQKITGVNALDGIIFGIKEAVKVGLHPVKINMVLLKGLNEDEIPSMIDFAKENNVIIQIIEFESPYENNIYKMYHAEMDSVENYLKNRAYKIIIRRMHHRRKYYLTNGSIVEVVKPMHNTEFCKNCNRIRITSDGKVKPCLFRNNNLIDILGPIRKGDSKEVLKNYLLKAIDQREPYFT
jgi:cyclic pyranopterin phosphate synthase